MSIRDQVRDFIYENFLFGDSDNRLKDDQSFLDSGVIDSTGVLELVTFVEETFKIKIFDEEIIPENLDSVDRLVQFINDKKEKAPAVAEESTGIFGI